MLPKKTKILFLPILALVMLMLSTYSVATIAGFKNIRKTEKRIIIRNNVLKDSGFGIYIGTQYDQVLVENNLISQNAEGIRVLGIRAASLIRKNDISNNIVGIKVKDTYSHNQKGLIHFQDMAIQSITINSNNIVGNDEYGVLNFTDTVVNANRNFWGSAEGPPNHKNQDQGKNSNRGPIIPVMLDFLNQTSDLAIRETVTSNLKLGYRLSEMAKWTAKNTQFQLYNTTLTLPVTIGGLSENWKLERSTYQSFLLAKFEISDWEEIAITKKAEVSVSGNLVSENVNFGNWLTTPIKTNATNNE